MGCLVMNTRLVGCFWRKEDNETWTKIVLLSVALHLSDLQDARRVPEEVHGYVDGWEWGSCIMRTFVRATISRGFQCAPRNTTSLFDHPHHNSLIKESRFPSLSIMIPSTQSVWDLPRCLPNGILSFDIFDTTSPPFPRLLLLIVLASWSCQNDHCHGRPPGK